MKIQNILVTCVSIGLLLSGCATVKGTVFKQADGTYKGTYSAKNERDALKVIHDDAKIYCKKEENTEKYLVVTQNVDKMTEQSGANAKEGFAAVAGTAVTALDKFYGSENVRGTIIFKCEK